MFQPSGKGSIWILTTRVQATCNLESIVITAMQLSFKGHHLRHYNSKAIFQRPRDPKISEQTDDDENEKQKTSILRVGAKCEYARRPPNKLQPETAQEKPLAPRVFKLLLFYISRIRFGY